MCDKDRFLYDRSSRFIVGTLGYSCTLLQQLGVILIVYSILKVEKYRLVKCAGSNLLIRLIILNYYESILYSVRAGKLVNSF